MLVLMGVTNTISRMLGWRSRRAAHVSRANAVVSKPESRTDASPPASDGEDRARKKPSTRERDMRRDEVFLGFFEKCALNSMTSMERLYGLYTSIEYIVRNQLPGDIVECGVWRGGSMMMAALSLLHFGDKAGRRLFLFDTFEGMPAPTGADYKFDGMQADEKWQSLQRGEGSEWNNVPIEIVRDAMASTNYPEDKIVLVKGRVEDTLPIHGLDQIALLRLDTDFYASTKQELTHLYPRLVPGGVLIVDDFGTWAGSHRAVVEYFDEHDISILLSRLDAAGRIGIKSSSQSTPR
ncbi:MAG: TylF/MycF/NovP-related O-methyltransferase [Xanthobacteraceae bacterium]